MNITIELKRPFLAASMDKSNVSVGGTLRVTGTKEGNYSTIAISMTNNTLFWKPLSGNLPFSGVKPSDFSVYSTTGNYATFGTAPPLPDGSFNYTWNTSLMAGGSLLPGSRYGFIVENTPVSIDEAFASKYPDNYYSKFSVLIDGVYADYAVDRMSGASPLTVAFTDVSITVPNGTNSAMTTIYFGDGASVSGWNGTVTHTYTGGSATYYPSITVCDNGGVCDTRSNVSVSVLAGNIQVNSAPGGAKIFLDGTDTGHVTNATLSSLTPGYHRVNVTLATYYPQEQSVYVEDGITKTVSFTLTKISDPTGNLSVYSNLTNAMIYIDGIDSGQLTNSTITGIVGDHSVTLTSDNYFNATRAVNIAGGTTEKVTIIMDPIPQTYTEYVATNVSKILKEELNEDTSLKTAASTPDQVDAGLTIHVWGDQEPITAPSSKSTVVAIDQDPGANWEHPICYVFLDESGQKTTECRMSPATDLSTEQVSGTAYNASGENLNMIGSGTTTSMGGGLGYLALAPAGSSMDCSNNYFLLIDGGYNTTMNHIRYFNDISFMYQTINQTYACPADHIQVLMSDGLDMANDRHNWTSADGKSNKYDNSSQYFDDGRYGIEVTGNATLSTVTQALRFQDAKFNNKDIYIVTTGHGGNDTVRNEAYYWVWNETKLYASDFVNNLTTNGNQNLKNVTIIMEQCNSGGFVDKFIPQGYAGPQNRVIATAAKQDQYSKDNGYILGWTMAMARIDRSMALAIPADQPAGAGDQKISIWEASDYAARNDPYLSVETPQYKDYVATYSTPTQGKNEFLSTCSAVTSALKLISPPAYGNQWMVGYPHNIIWGQTGLDGKVITVSVSNGSEYVLGTPTAAGSPGTLSWTPNKLNWQPNNNYQVRITNATTGLTDQKPIILLSWVGPGLFKIDTIPHGAFIYLDGINTTKKTYQSSIQVSPLPEYHVVGLKMDGYVEQEGSYSVSAAGKTTTINLTLVPVTTNGVGDLHVTSSPVPAQVIIDDNPTGMFTPYDGQMEPGTYTVTVSAFGYKAPEPESQMVTIYKGQPAIVEFTLAPEKWLYTVSPFASPIEPGVINTAKAGQAIPVKWHLSNVDGDISDPASFVNLRSYSIDCASGTPEEAINETAAGNSGLQYLGDGNWQYNWKTSKSYAKTCRNIYVEFDHGQQSQEVQFKFK